MAKVKLTIGDLIDKREKNIPITAITAHDFTTASLIEAAGIDMALVGDSLGITVLGYPDTRPVTMDEMIHHAKAVYRGTKTAFLVGDMPYLSYQGSESKAVRNAGRFMKEAGMDSIKVEGGDEAIPAIKAISSAGIPAMGHVIYPQRTGRVSNNIEEQIKNIHNFIKLVDNIETAGAFGIVLARIPAEIAKLISERTSMITIGIGSGPYCHAQVLVSNDMLGLSTKKSPEFNKQFINLAPLILNALEHFKEEVIQRSFPSPDYYSHVNNELIDALVNQMDS